MFEMSTMLWVDKYKPKEIEQIIGNRQNVDIIISWLNGFSEAVKEEQKNNKAEKKKTKKADSRVKALLIAGPPGSGKTSSCHLIGNLFGFNCVEVNASDIRNKSGMKEIVKQVSKYKSLTDFFANPKKATTNVLTNKTNAAVPITNVHKEESIADILKRKQLEKQNKLQKQPIVIAPKLNNTNGKTKMNLMIVDEVDGIDGYQDKGGIRELISIIDQTEHPIICICNELQGQKLKSLKTHCRVLYWKPPTVDQIVPSMMRISKLENCSFTRSDIESFVLQSSCDIRQTINLMQMKSNNNPLSEQKMPTTTSSRGTINKDQSLDVFQTINEMLLTTSQGSKDKYIDKIMNWYFSEPFMLGLFLFENYLKLPLCDSNINSKQNRSLQELNLIHQTIDSMSIADNVDKLMLQTSNFDLMPEHAFFSCVVPCFNLQGQEKYTRVDFPSGILGNMSSTKKRKEILYDLKTSMGNAASMQEVVDVLPLLSIYTTQPMIMGQVYGKVEQGIKQCVQILHEYGLNREDWQNIQDISNAFNSNKADNTNKIDLEPTTKAAFTRKLNAASKTNKRQKLDKKQNEEEEENEEDELSS